MAARQLHLGGVVVDLDVQGFRVRKAADQRAEIGFVQVADQQARFIALDVDGDVIVIAIEAFPGVPFGGFLEASMDVVQSMRFGPAVPSETSTASPVESPSTAASPLPSPPTAASPSPIVTPGSAASA